MSKARAAVASWLLCKGCRWLKEGCGGPEGSPAHKGEMALQSAAALGQKLDGWLTQQSLPSHPHFPITIRYRDPECKWWFLSFHCSWKWPWCLYSPPDLMFCEEKKLPWRAVKPEQAWASPGRLKRAQIAVLIHWSRLEPEDLSF